MLRQYELVERVRAYDPQADEDLLNRAYVFSMKAHGSQLRASGDPYFSHPIEVAGILTDLKLDDETIATGILHDTIEDTVATQEQIDKLFGPAVGRLVDGVTKLSKIKAQTESERAAENLRKFLLAMSDDIRVLLVKLADRLHNMRTLKHLKNPDKRRRIARETMDIYAPLAGRIGMYEFMDELNELAFRELEPEGHASVTARLERLRAGGGDVVSRITSGLKLLLAQNGVDADVWGREKQPLSIWRKMHADHKSFEALTDVMAFRVIVASPADCYRALGIIHQRWPAFVGRFKDFISAPKANGYRSLHTTVMHSGIGIEVQIRDAAMHREAELGLAAHWAYKSGNEGAAARESYPWLNDLLEILDHAATPEELLEHTRLAMFHDQVFVFTPKGELQQLPKGATPVDFAYLLHSEIGDTCVGARVNGRVVSLRTKLVNGDQVEILRSSIRAPDPAWESYVVTAKARAAVRRSARTRTRDAQLAMGRQLFDAAVAKHGLPSDDATVNAALSGLKLNDRNALYVALARQTIGDLALREALAPGSTEGAKRPRKLKPGAGAITIKGLAPGAAFTLGECCHPVPGDRIAGLSRPGMGVEVHGIDCATLAEEGQDWLELAWDANSGGAVARVATVVYNQPGSLAAVASIIAQARGNIVGLALKHRDREFHTNIIDIEVEGLAQLTAITAALRAAPAVVSVERVKA